MHFSQLLPSSPHCLPSPDGAWIATLLPPAITVTAVGSLSVVRSISLPLELAGINVTSFAWSPSSSRVLVGVSDQIHVFSAVGQSDYHATVRIPSAASVAKSTLVCFGPTDHEVCVWTAFGIKLNIFNLATSKAVEIANPKFHHAQTAVRGISFRPTTRHLALLTRTSGKDMISIHADGSREVLRSWHPDTTDAQGLEFSPDGKWLLVWESAAYGHRLLCYTADGHLFRDWQGPLPQPNDGADTQLGAGIKLLTFSRDGRFIVITNSSCCVYLLSAQSFVEEVRLQHPLNIQPRDTLQVWQETRQAGHMPIFTKATQAVAPPNGTTANSSQAPRSGCNLATFDASSTLLATKLDEAPSTVWIWDVSASELRAVILYHANVSTVEWHPTQPELLLMRCDGDGYNNLVFVWDPLSEGPRSVDFAVHFPHGKINGKQQGSWLFSSGETAMVFFADSSACMLVSLTENDTDTDPWRGGSTGRGKSPSGFTTVSADNTDDNLTDIDERLDEMDDTFHFKKFTAR